MIDALRLLAGLQPLRKRLEDDLRERSDQIPLLRQQFREEWHAARERERTAQTYEAWRDDALAQAAVMWLLACVFVRFLEDNTLVDPPRLAGPGAQLQLARDQRTLYFQAHPHDSDRDYLYSVFEAVAALPAAAPLFDHRHNPIWNIGISGDAAAALIDFWQRIDAVTGALVHEFTDPEWRTRFLGDLYQDLSESARKKYALLQTPDFVLQFILDRTLTPAAAEFGFREVRLIDPACGSGHFLLAAFERLFRLWALHEPGRNARELAQRALTQVSGVDLNPFAVAIARFRLLLAALRASNITRLADAPAFTMELAAGDSLLHGPRPGDQGQRQMYLAPVTDPLAHVYATEDARDLKRILGRRYHVVVGNPPYITPKDAALNKGYRDRFGSCHGKYSLGVPFTERLFDLTIEASDDGSPAGYLGMITANSFMRREFGKKLVEQYIPKWDLTHVVDTDKAHLPGHATGTVILFGRQRAPLSATVRAALGLRKQEPAPPVAEEGLVWQSILRHIEQPGFSDDYVNVVDWPRDVFEHHPWSIGGGGAAELKTRLDETASRQVADLADAIGITSVTGEDALYVFASERAARRLRIERVRSLIIGEMIRDWAVAEPSVGIWLYDDDFRLMALEELPGTHRLMWPMRAVINRRKRFGRPMCERGLTWYEWQELYVDKLRTPLSIAFAEVATHNHFFLDQGGTVFKQTAPVIKLPSSASLEEHIGLLGILNSSCCCFWLRQVCHDKGAGGIGGGIAAESWEHRYAFNSANVARLPLPSNSLSDLSAAIGSTAKCILAALSNSVSNAAASDSRGPREKFFDGLERAIAFQEELDWQCYGLYGVLDSVASEACGDPPRLRLGERAFEIVMARKMAAGNFLTAWFERHRSMPITEIPAHWPESYRQVVQRRIALIESNPEIALIEQPEYKRRWNVEPWEEQVQRAMRDWLLDRLELPSCWPDVTLTSIARLADRARQDPEFMRVATLYRGQDDFDASALVAELVESASVPFLPVLRYRASGLRKREQWERTWDLQRREDAGQDVGEIPVPPKYTSADFVNGMFWQLRGKLDVAKERFISYPFCQRDAAPTPVIAWAGWNYLQQAKALATYYVQMKESEGWSKERLTPLLAGLLELLPWLVQWHNEIAPEYGQRMGEFYEGFLDEEARALGLTREAIRAWTPPSRVGAADARSRRTTR